MGSKSGIRSVVLRMIDEGLVQEVPGGYLLLNRDHLAALAIELVATLHGELAARVRAGVGEWTSPPSLLGLIGSAARRDGDVSSDVDVLVISEDSDHGDRVDDLDQQIRRWTGNPAQVIGKSPKEIARLRAAGEPIIEELERDLVVLVGERSPLGGVS